MRAATFFALLFCRELHFPVLNYLFLHAVKAFTTLAKQFTQASY